MSDNKTTIPMTLTITNWKQDAANEIARINNIDLTGCKTIEEQLNCLADLLYSTVWNQFVYIMGNEEIILCDIRVTLQPTGKSFPAFGIL